MQTIKDFGAFLWAVFSNWAGYSTGGVIVATVALWHTLRNIPVSRKIALTLAGVFLLMALFKAWQDQYHSVQASTPALRLQIDEVGVGRTKTDPNDQDTNLFIIANLVNRGAPSVADEWSLKVDIPGRPTVMPSIILLRADGVISFDGQNGNKIVLSQANSLYDKAIAQPIQQGSKVRGIMAFRITGVPASQVASKGTELTLQCKDIAEQDVTASYAMKGGSSDKYQHYPGITAPN